HGEREPYRDPGTRGRRGETAGARARAPHGGRTRTGIPEPGERRGETEKGPAAAPSVFSGPGRYGSRPLPVFARRVTAPVVARAGAVMSPGMSTIRGSGCVWCWTRDCWGLPWSAGVPARSALRCGTPFRAFPLTFFASALTCPCFFPGTRPCFLCPGTRSFLCTGRWPCFLCGAGAAGWAWSRDGRSAVDAVAGLAWWPGWPIFPDGWALAASFTGPAFLPGTALPVFVP